MNVSSVSWVDVVTGALAVIGSLAALIGSFGLLRFRTFFQRVHTPTLGATIGTWAFAAATVSQVSFAAGKLYVHVLLIAVLLALTAPVTAVLLMRAALLRARTRGEEGVPFLPRNAPSKQTTD
jgi:multicomponent K+:H+ antiporter subunit G